MKIKRTTEEISICDRATAEKIKYNFCFLYPENVGKEQKIEQLVAKEMEKLLEVAESNIQMTKLLKCKTNMNYSFGCPTLINSALQCKWNGTENFCYPCGAADLMKDLEERCRMITNDRQIRDGTNNLKYFMPTNNYL